LRGGARRRAVPDRGGQQVCGLFDLKPNKVGQVSRLTTSAGNYGAQREHWNGLDLTVNARMARGALVQGGLSTGKTMTDNCEVVAKVREAPAASLGLGNGLRFCHTETPFLTQVKFLASYTLPWQIQVAGTFQSIPGPEITANYVARSAQVAPSLGRQLSSASTVTINLVEPGTYYAERTNQFDIRFAKIFTFGRTRVHGSFDLYNALNGSSVLQLNNTYGTSGASWQVPQSVLPARLAKFSIQVNF
jgi:hypothetical protein